MPNSWASLSINQSLSPLVVKIFDVHGKPVSTERYGHCAMWPHKITLNDNSTERVNWEEGGGGDFFGWHCWEPMLPHQLFCTLPNSCALLNTLSQVLWMWLHSHPLVLWEGRPPLLQERLLGLLRGHVSRLLRSHHRPHHGECWQVASRLHHSRLFNLLTRGWPLVGMCGISSSLHFTYCT